MSTTVLTHGRVTWTNIIQPTLPELNQLGERYPQFHPLNLHDCLSPLEFPKLDHHDDYIIDERVNLCDWQQRIGNR